MYWRTKRLVWEKGVTAAFLQALDTRPAAVLLAATRAVNLYTEGAAPTPLSAFADFTPCDFSGYAPVVPDPMVAVVNLGGTDLGLVVSVVFTADGSIDANQSAKGYFLGDSGDEAFYAGEQFDVPFGFSNPGDFLQIDLVLPLPGIFAPVIV